MRFLVVCLALIIAVVRCDEGQPEADLFSKMDTNKDDQLTRLELDNLFLLFDVDGDGTVSPDEFVDDWTNQFNLGNVDQAQTVFTRADTNDDGYVNSMDIPGIFAFFDENGDGLVDISEFLTGFGSLALSSIDNESVSIDITG